MSRPTHTPAKGPSFQISVPPGWHAMISAISRNAYDQAVEVVSRIPAISYEDSRIFGSKRGLVNDQMQVDGCSSLPLIAQEDAMTFDFTFFYSATPVKNTDLLVDNDARSNKISVLRTEKQPGSFDGPDTVTYFVFVEDTPDSTQTADSGQYDDAVTTIHFVQKE